MRQTILEFSGQFYYRAGQVKIKKVKMCADPSFSQPSRLVMADRSHRMTGG